jgi:hypothetical protein
MAPVMDHPIHASTQHGEDFRYGCHSNFAPLVKSPGYWVKVRAYKPDGTFDMVDEFVLHNMSVLCRFSMRKDDLNCRDCTNESDREYLEGYGIELNK